MVKATSLIEKYKLYLRRRGLVPDYHVLKASAVFRQLPDGGDVREDIDLRIAATNNKSLRSTFRIFLDFLRTQKTGKIINDIPDLSTIRRSMWKKHRKVMKEVRSVEMPLVSVSRLKKIGSTFEGKDGIIFYLLAFQGLRREDFAVLEWKHVDIDSNSIILDGERVALFKVVKMVLIQRINKGLLSKTGKLIPRYSSRMVDRVTKQAAERAGLDPRYVSSRDWRYNALRLMVKHADLKFVIHTFRVKLLAELPGLDSFRRSEY